MLACMRRGRLKDTAVTTAQAQAQIWERARLVVEVLHDLVGGVALLAVVALVAHQQRQLVHLHPPDPVRMQRCTETSLCCRGTGQYNSSSLYQDALQQVAVQLPILLEVSSTCRQVAHYVGAYQTLAGSNIACLS